MEYVIVRDGIYRIKTLDEIRIAQAAMREAGIPVVKTWTCPYDTLEEAQAAGWKGAVKTVGFIVANPGEETE